MQHQHVIQILVDGRYGWGRADNVDHEDGQVVFSMYLQAAKQGHMEAQVNALLERRRCWWMRCGWQNAVGLYLSRRLVDYGDEQSMMMEAANWYARAAEQGLASAWGNIAILYEFGAVRTSVTPSPYPP